MRVQRATRGGVHNRCRAHLHPVRRDPVTAPRPMGETKGTGAVGRRPYRGRQWAAQKSGLGEGAYGQQQRASKSNSRIARWRMAMLTKSGCCGYA